ncbi:MAG TPA: tetratricopeptide repeat protein [Oculatellaceae cyanobacterium]|jgi:tetratricopeptide (TPR) repeat protein
MSTSPRVLAFEPRHVQRKRQQALAYFREAYQAQLRKDYSWAIEKYQQSIEIYPTAEAHTFLGWTYSHLGELDLAIEECQRAISIDPDFGNPYNDIGAYLIAQGEYRAATPYLYQALKAKRYRAYHFAHFNLGRAKEYQGDYFNAYRHYRQALQIDPRYWIARRAIEQLNKRLVR